MLFRSEALVNLSEESTGLLELQVVLSIELTLVDCCAEFALLGLAFSCGDVNVKTDNIARGEFELLNTLVRSLFVDDDIVAVDKVLLELVREDSLNGVDTELFADLSNSLCYLGVSCLFTDDSLCSEHSVVSSEDNIGFLSADL